MGERGKKEGRWVGEREKERKKRDKWVEVKERGMDGGAPVGCELSSKCSLRASMADGVNEVRLLRFFEFSRPP